MLADKINLIRITNPFDPREHLRESLEFVPGANLEHYFPLNALEAEQVYSVNGKIIEREDFKSVVLSAGDSLVCCPLPQGGGGSKSILRIVTMIAISVFAPQFALALNNSLNLGLTTFGLKMLSAGIGLVGNMLVSALLPAPKATARAVGGSDLDSSPSYGIDGAKNTSAEGIVVPVVYGQFRIGGNILQNYVVNEGNTQILFMLLCAGEGPISGISDVEINDQPIANFKDYEVRTRLGGGSQGVLGWFDDTIEPHSIGATLTEDWTTYTTSQEVDRLRLDFVAPAGLTVVNPDTGATSKATVNIEVEYRLGGTADPFVPLGGDSQIVDSYTESVQWAEIAVYDYGVDPEGSESPISYQTYVPTGNENRIGDQYFATLYDAPYDGEYVVVGTVIRTPNYVSGISLSDKTRSPVRRSLTSNDLPEAIYDIRVRRTTAESVSEYVVDQVILSDVNEILTENIAYRNTALLALKIRLSDQLNGLPKVTFLVSGRLVRAWDPVAEKFVSSPTSNPAWITMDIMTNKRYGGALPWGRFNLAKFKELAAFDEANGLMFNGVFDTSMNVWDAAQLVLRTGHAQLVNVGTRYTLAIEKEEDPVMMFSVANMIEGTFQQNWLPLNDRANEIEAIYFDKEDKYKQKTVRIVDERATAGGLPIKSSSVTLFGVTNVDQAYKDAQMLLNMNRYILQTVEFAAPIEAIGATVGDIIYVQHDMPQWGYSGRLEAGSTNDVMKLDRPVNMQPATNYTFLVLMDTVSRFTGTISAISGTAGNYKITLANYDGSTNIKRLVSGTKDLEVLSTFESGGTFGVVVTSSTGLAVSQAYELWDTDVMEERNVILALGDNTEIGLVTPLSGAPGVFSNWMFGEIGKVKKPFRIKAITGSHEYRRDITAIEYNPTVYDMSGVVIPTPNYSDLPIAPEHVVISNVSEILFKVNKSIRSEVTVHYNSTAENYARSEVFVSKNGGRFQTLGVDPYRMSINADDGDVLIFKVVARDVLGVSAPQSSAPTVEYTVVGKTAKPLDVQGFTYEIQPSFINLSWTANTDIDLLGYEIRKGTDWDTATLVVNKVSGNVFPISKITAGVHDYLIKAIDTTGNYSVNAATVQFTINPPVVADVQVSIANGDYQLNWNDTAGSFEIDKTEIRHGASFAAGATVAILKGNTYKAAINWQGIRTFWVAVYDVTGNVSAAVSVDAEILLPGVNNFVATISGKDYTLSWNPLSGTQPIRNSEIRYGADWDTGTTIATLSGNTYSGLITWAESRTFWVRAFDISANEGSVASVVLNITAPAAPSVSSAISADLALLTWTVPTSSLPIDKYEIRYGASYGAGVSLGQINGTTFSLPVNWGGSRTFWVAAINTNGTTGTAGSTTVAITNPSAPTITPQVIDNNVLLRWTEAVGSLPIARYEIKKGSVYGSATTVGVAQARFATFFEDVGGVFTYWVVAYDTAGNAGTPNSISVQVNQPPDYVLFANQDSTFSGTIVNGKVEADGILFNVNLTETYQQHFDNNSWATPQAQVTAGFDRFIQPSLTTGSYEETIDFGAVVSTLITITPTTSQIVGTTTITPTISIKKLSGDAWTDYAGAYSIFGTEFQFVKVRLDFASSGGDDLLKLSALNIKLDVKLRSYQNDVYCLPTDIGGTVVEGDTEAGELWTLQGTADFDFDSSGQPALVLDGTSGCFVSTPDSSAVDLTGDLDIRVRTSADDWTPAAIASVFGKHNTTVTGSYFLRINTSGTLNLLISDNVGPTAVSVNSSVATGFTDGTAHWIRATRRVSDGRVQFFTSEDYNPATRSGTWNQLGTDVTLAAGTPMNVGSSLVNIGARGGTGATGPYAGKVYYAEILNGLDGPTVAAFNAADSIGTLVDITDKFVDLRSITITGQGGTAKFAGYNFVDTPNPTQFRAILWDKDGNRVAGWASWKASGV